MIEMQTDGDDFIRNAKQLKRIMDSEAEKLAKEAGAFHKAMIESKSPVDIDGEDPGELKRNWKMEYSRLGNHGHMITMSNPVDYTWYVERGHRLLIHGKHVGYIKGKFFVRKSMKETRKEIARLYKELDQRLEARLR